MGSWFFMGLLLAAIGSGVVFGIKHHNEINELRPPKDSWKQGHKLRIKTPEQMAAERRRTVRPKYIDTSALNQSRQPLDANDLDEMEGMFGSAGDSPSDY